MSLRIRVADFIHRSSDTCLIRSNAPLRPCRAVETMVSVVVEPGC